MEKNLIMNVEIVQRNTKREKKRVEGYLRRFMEKKSKEERR